MKKNKIKKQKQRKKEEPLTLSGLVNYGHKVLFPYMNETFATKKELNDFKNEFNDLKNESLTGQDKILEKLDILMTEKDTKHFQDKKQKKILEIHNESLKRGKILSPQEIETVAKLEFF